MKKVFSWAVVVVGLTATSWQARSAEDKEQKLKADETQAYYTRKSITYVGLQPSQGITLVKGEKSAIEKALKPAVELKRFDYNAVNPAEFGSLDGFVQALREYVKKRSVDRAAAEAEYELRFKSARVYASDIDRIMSSAYLYLIEVSALRAAPWVCWDEVTTVPAKKPGEKPRQKVERKCRQGDPQDWKEEPEVRVAVQGKVVFLRANLLDESKPATAPLAAIRWGGDDVQGYAGMPRPPERRKLPPNATDKMREEAEEQYHQDLERYQQALAEYRQKLPELQLQARVQAVRSVAGGSAGGVEKQVKSIPDFQLKSPVVGMHDDRVQFMMGQAEGVLLDDTYDVTEFDASGAKNLIGYVKVRDVGDAQGSGQGTPSEAEKVREKRDFAGGELLYEHPMMGMSWSPFFQFQWDLLGMVDEAGPLFGGGMAFDFDLANAFGAPEIYLSVVLDYLYAGDDFHLPHFTLGLHKKWYATSLVFDLGGRVGLGALVYGGEEGASPYNEDSKVSVGGLLTLGLEWYIIPEFSLFLRAEGGYFAYVSGRSYVDDEVKVNAQVGLIVSF
ncbi:MAG TPA: hypothetical protein PK668_23365 [Myxococcota bacterium]|nr:hypothetical protein [Myxococcota bacterium]HRY96511.1 hypothetical protein [Myxococcota bacterium]